MAYIIRFVGKHVQSRWPLLQKTITLWEDLGTRAIFGRKVEVTDQKSRQVNSFGYGLPVPPRCEPTSFARPCPWEQQLEKDGHFAIDLDEQPRNNPRSCSFDATRNSAIITGQPATNSIKRKPLPFKNKEENQGLDRCCSLPPALAERSATDLIDECYDSGIEMYYPSSSMRTTVDEVAGRADGELIGGQVNDEVRGYYAGARDIDYDGNIKIDGVFNNAERFIQVPATPAIEPAKEHVLEGQGRQSVVFLASDPIERSVIIDSGEDEIGGTDTAGNDFQPSALRTIEPVNDEVDKEGDSIGPLISLEIEQITIGDEVDSKIDGATAVAENDILEPASSAIESGAEYSEADEADFMKLLSNAPVVIQDSDGESQAVNAVIDTGASSSFISKEVAHQYGLKEMPLPRHEIKSFANFNCEWVTPKTFVVIQVKCSKIGLNKFVQMSVRVLNNEKFDIIFGRPFIQEHGILHQIIPTSQFDTNRNTLLMIQEKHSEDAKPLVEYEEIDSNPTTTVEYTLSVPPPSNSEIDPTAAADTTLSTLSSDVSESESSSMEDDSDLDDDRITEVDARPSIIGIPSIVLGMVENDVYLTNLVRSLGRALVEQLMTEFWELFNQEWVDYMQKCPDISESTTTSQPRPKDKSSAQESTKNNKKRSWGNEENENPDENDRGPPKRPKKVLGPIGLLDSRNKFACPYRKYDPRKYCAHSQNRKWRSCAMTPLADISRVKYMEPL
jgi:gag-polyprotein putative aspartyl protease